MAYGYKKTISISGSSGAGADYQVRLEIGESSGSVGADVHLEEHAESFPSDKDDGGDITFFDDTETQELPFWVESVSGVTPNRVATVWVKVLDNLDTNKDINIRYGDAGASNKSDGVATFLLFDDFDGESYDSEKWDLNGTSFNDPSGGYAHVGDGSNDYDDLFSVDSFNANIRFRTKSDFGNTGAGDVKIGLENLSPDDTSFGLFHCKYTYNPDIHTRVGNSSGTEGTAGGSDTGYDTGTTQRIWEVARKTGGGRIFSVDDSVVRNTDTYASTDPEHIKYISYDSGQIHDVDWVFIGKFVDTEPAFSSASAEIISALEVDTVSVTNIADFYVGELEIQEIDPIVDPTKIGFVYDTESQSDPNLLVDPTPETSGYDDYVEETGNYTVDFYTDVLENLDANTVYYARAFAYDSVSGYVFGDEIQFNTNLAPVIDSVTPHGLLVDQEDTSITITGDNFRAGLTVDIDGEACTNIVVVDINTITCDAPVSAVAKDSILTVTNDDTQSGTIDFFYIESVPETQQPAEVTATFSVTGIGVTK